jgi:hypothetical protein
MAQFSIQHGPTPLCIRDLETDSSIFHPSTNHRDGSLLLEETDKVGFVLCPATPAAEYRIAIGDLPLSDLLPLAEDADGTVVGSDLFWRDFPYFESAHGWTTVILEARLPAATADGWRKLCEIQVYVLPSKLSEERYQQMAADLGALSRSLLVDLYGKSKQTLDVRLAREARACRSWEQELATIDSAIQRLAVLLLAIQQRPASHIRGVPCLLRWWGQERLLADALKDMCRRGLDPRTAPRPILISGRRKTESFDIAEHRVTRAFLDILMRRAEYCEEAARRHLDAIEADRRLRDVHFGDKQSLYETIDLPQIKRLRKAIDRARQAKATAATLADFPFLRDARPELSALRDGVFQRSPEYEALLAAIRQYLASNAVWFQAPMIEKGAAPGPLATKLTSRLFEQWCYLKVVEAFRESGLELREWSDALRQNLQARFVLDFNRGLTFEGALTPHPFKGALRLRLRYEPWILGQSAAVQADETLFRGSDAEVPWCPDIVLECLKSDGQAWRPVYGIVMDCKYVAQIRPYHWQDTAKYMTIRATGSRRQIVRQLWLIALAPSPLPLSPGERAEGGAIVSEDPAITFDDNGATCFADENVRFRMEVQPVPAGPATASGTVRTDAFAQFARGTIQFLCREFGSA